MTRLSAECYAVSHRGNAAIIHQLHQEHYHETPHPTPCAAMNGIVAKNRGGKREMAPNELVRLKAILCF